MKRLTPLLLLLFIASSLGGCRLFASDVSAESTTTEAPETDTDAGGDRDVPPEPDAMPPENH